ncbi:hypothetical protein [Clostridium sp. ZBS15]|uniref:hypothetical protein n=1 Tax=Clostridium sp. ZBS15 TaxID=2949969 RepID=UPI00207A99F3|nr:hypothetical protein [Clostridium sp. ZBS15]
MKTNDYDIPTEVEHIVFPKYCDCLNKKINTSLEDTGKLLLVKVHLKNILYDKNLAVGVLVFEGPILRAFKVKEIYTGNCDGMCKYHDIKTPTYYFVFADKEDCSKKDFSIKIIKNYTNINK